MLAVKLRPQMPFFITDTDFGPQISLDLVRHEKERLLRGQNGGAQG